MTTSEVRTGSQRPLPRAERRAMERRGGPRKEARRWTARRWALLGAIVVVAGAIGYAVWHNRAETARVRQAWAEELKQVESFPEEPADHVPPGTAVQYRTEPPTSGQHYSGVAPAGMHDQAVDPRLLVHNLEHGNVVIYYDRDALPPEAVERLRELTGRYRGYWDGVLAVPRSDREHPLVLTAWTKMLRLKEFRPAAVDAFIDAYRGRGPEKPVR